MSQAKRDAFMSGFLWRVFLDGAPGCDNEARAKVEASRRYPDETPAPAGILSNTATQPHIEYDSAGYPHKTPPEAARRWRCKECGDVLPNEAVVFDDHDRGVWPFHWRGSDYRTPCGPVVEEGGEL